MSHNQLWKEASKTLQGMLNPDLFTRWFAPVKPLELKGDVLVLGVANEFSQIWLQDNFLPLVREAVNQTSKQPLQVQFAIAPSLATDPNPAHGGKAFGILQRSGISVTHGVLAEPCAGLNKAFNHWMVHRTPFVTVKAAMTLDGKIATASGQSKWITGEAARAYAMNLRQGADAILVGINTILADDPSLTVRTGWTVQSPKSKVQSHRLRRIVLDTRARTPLNARVVSDEHASLTTIVVSQAAPEHRVAALAKRVRVLVAPGPRSKISLRWLLKKLGAENVTNLLVEGGGEVNASFLMEGLAHRVAFFYAPKILGGSDSVRAVGGPSAARLSEIVELDEIEWRKIGTDLLLTARVVLCHDGTR